MLALTVVQAVRRHLVSRRVIAVASSPSARLAAGRSDIDEWHSPEAAGLHVAFGEEGELDGPLAGHLASAGAVLSFLGEPGGPVHERLQRASRAPVFSVDPRPRQETLDNHRHITSQWADDLRAEGLALAGLLPPRVNPAGTSTPPPAPDAATALIHAGSGGAAKCWPVERYIELADRLSMPVAWMLGPAEMERDARRFDAVRRRSALRGERLIVEEDLAAASEAITLHRLYIGNDAGMTHVAAALGVPTLAVFGPTDPAVWRPLGEHVAAVRASTPGGLAALRVDTVLAAVASLTAEGHG